MPVGLEPVVTIVLASFCSAGVDVERLGSKLPSASLMTYILMKSKVRLSPELRAIL